MPLCLTAATRPIRRCSLAPVVSASRPSRRAHAGGARSVRRACHPPGRAKTNAGGAGGRPLVLVHPSSRAKPAASGGSVRALPLATGSRSRRLESTGPDLTLTYVAYVYFNCFRRFICMMQLFYFDVAKVDRGMLHMLNMLQVF